MNNLASKTLGLLPYFVFLSFLFFDFNAYDSYQHPKAFAFFLILFFFSLLLLFSEQKKEKMSFAFYPALLLCLYFSIRVSFSEHIMPFYFKAVYLSPCIFFLFYFFKPEKIKFCFLINFLFSTVSILSLYQHLFSGISRPYSFLGNPIFSSEFLGALFPFILFGLHLKKPISVFSLINIFLGIISIMVMSSRGPLLSLILSALIFVLFGFKWNFKNFKKSSGSLITIFAVIFFILFIPVFKNSFTALLDRIKSASDFSSSSVINRIFMAKASFLIASKNPVFGEGPGSVRTFIQEKLANIRENNYSVPFINTSYSHNDYMQTFAETGLLGNFLMLLLLISVSFSFQKNASLIPRNDFLFKLAAACSIIFFITESFFNFPLYIMPSSTMFFAFLGTVASEDYDKNKKYFGFNLYAFSAAAILFSVFLVLFSSRTGSLVSNYYSSKPDSEIFIKKALSIDPFSYKSRFLLADHLLKKGNVSLSYFHFERLSRIYNSADMNYNAGLTALLSGLKTESKLHFTKAKYLCPELFKIENFSGNGSSFKKDDSQYKIIIFKELSYEWKFNP